MTASKKEVKYPKWPNPKRGKPWYDEPKIWKYERKEPFDFEYNPPRWPRVTCEALNVGDTTIGVSRW